MSPGGWEPLARAAPEPCLALGTCSSEGSMKHCPLCVGTRSPRGPGSGSWLLSLLLPLARRFHCVLSRSFSNCLFLPDSQCLCSLASRSSPPQEPGPPRPPLPKSYVPLESPPTIPPLPSDSRPWPYPTSPSWQHSGEAKRGQVPTPLWSSQGSHPLPHQDIGWQGLGRGRRWGCGGRGDRDSMEVALGQGTAACGW